MPATPLNCELRRISQSQYFNSGAFDLVRIIPPPPAADSQQQRDDVELVLAAQREARRAGQTARGVADALMSCARVATVLNTEFNEQRVPRTLAFLERAAFQATSAAGPGKGYWWRPRPYVASSAVERLADKAPVPPGGKPFVMAPPFPGNVRYPTNAQCDAIAAGEEPPPAPADPAPAAGATTPAANTAPPVDDWREDFRSYPSGHAAFGYACGVLLSDMVPEQRRELMARGIEYGQSRLIVGAHYASDVEQSRVVAAVALAEMQQNAAFRRDFDVARSELREAMGLPATLPDVRPAAPKRPTPAPARRPSDAEARSIPTQPPPAARQ